jgi:hypothetical protein
MPARPPFAQFDETGVVYYRVPRPIGATPSIREFIRLHSC